NKCAGAITTSCVDHLAKRAANDMPALDGSPYVAPPVRTFRIAGRRGPPPGDNERPIAVHNLRRRYPGFGAGGVHSRLMVRDLSQWSDSHEGALLARNGRC